jgi:hypothetical protein
VMEARADIERCFRLYNHERLHESLGYRTSAVMTRGKRNDQTKRNGALLDSGTPALKPWDLSLLLQNGQRPRRAFADCGLRMVRTNGVRFCSSPDVSVR